jgi:hypothetical protein
MAMTSVSVMMTVFVLNLHYRGPKKNEIPFWIQELLGLSLANVIQTFRKSNKFKIPCKSEQNSRKKDSYDTSRNRKAASFVSPNGILLSYASVNEKKNHARVTTDVSAQRGRATTERRNSVCLF